MMMSEDEKGKAPPRDFPPPSDGLAGRYILVIEQNGLQALHMTMLLEEMACHVVGPARGMEDAIALMDTRQPIDVAIVDVHPNEMASLQVLSPLAARGLPIILMTAVPYFALPTPYDRIPLLTKPFARRDLQSCLRQVLARSNKDAER